MGTANSILMLRARKALSGKWWFAVGLCFVFFIVILIIVIFIAIMPIIGILIFLAVGGSLMFGMYNTMLSIARGKKVVFNQILNGFSRYMVSDLTFLYRSIVVSVLAFLCMGIFIFIWSISFVILVITMDISYSLLILLVMSVSIVAISYSITFFIMADNPNIHPLKAIRKSKQMMYGYKWKFFCLCCRFIGWTYLCPFTLGIGFLWLTPYIYVSMAKFYDDIKRD